MAETVEERRERLRRELEATWTQPEGALHVNAAQAAQVDVIVEEIANRVVERLSQE